MNIKSHITSNFAPASDSRPYFLESHPSLTSLMAVNINIKTSKATLKSKRTTQKKARPKIILRKVTELIRNLFMISKKVKEFGADPNYANLNVSAIIAVKL